MARQSEVFSRLLDMGAWDSISMVWMVPGLSRTKSCGTSMSVCIEDSGQAQGAESTD